MCRIQCRVMYTIIILKNSNQPSDQYRLTEAISQFLNLSLDNNNMRKKQFFFFFKNLYSLIRKQNTTKQSNYGNRRGCDTDM